MGESLSCYTRAGFLEVPLRKRYQSTKGIPAKIPAIPSPLDPHYITLDDTWTVQVDVSQYDWIVEIPDIVKE